MKVTINHINDVLPYIEPDKGIIVSKRQNYTIIDYVYNLPDTFNCDMALQCRGLKFDSQGNLIARPFHKFFNIGEKQSPEQIDWSIPHLIFDKLDGSFIHPAILDNELVFMTRMGITDQSKKAFSIASDNVKSLSNELLKSEITPLFEYTAPDNRIIIEYSKAEITLLAARHSFSGEYLQYDELTNLSEIYNVPLVANYGKVEDYKSFIKNTRSLIGKEGFVIAFNNGEFLKIKADDYTLKHNILDDIRLEKNVLSLVLQNKTDDVYSLVSPEIADKLKYYENSVQTGITNIGKIIDQFYLDNKDKDRKEYAAIVRQNLDKRLGKIAFSVADGKDTRQMIVDELLKSTRSINHVDAIRDLFNFKWNEIS